MNYFKAVYVKKGKYISWSIYAREHCPGLCCHYKIGRFTHKKTNPLLVFDSLAHTVSFINENAYRKDFEDFAVLECECVLSKNQDLSFLGGKIPNGSICTDKTKPIREIPQKEYIGRVL
jgi:hypothetical protein